MRTLFRCMWWPLVWIVFVGCAPVPEHDNPRDPENSNYKPYDGSVRMESVRGGDCKPGDSCLVVAVLEARDGAPKVDAVWVQMCGSEQPDDFTSMTYEERQQKWVHRFAAPAVGVFAVPMETSREGRGLDSQPLMEKSAGDSPCWFVVRDVDCKCYLIGPAWASR